MHNANTLFPTVKQKVLGTRHCEKCGQEYEIKEISLPGRKIVATECMRCKIQEENRELAEQALLAKKRLELEQYKKISRIPLELNQANFKNYHPNNPSQKEALRVAQNFAIGNLNETTLFFQGDTGLGKSHLSHAVFEVFSKNEKTAIFVDMPSLLSQIRGTYSKKSDLSQEKIMKLIESCELLVLDDIGAEYVKPDENGFESWAADILFQIVNLRQRKMTIYTTNFSSKQLAEKYGMMSKRIISRMMNNAKILKMDGKDYRLRGLD